MRRCEASGSCQPPRRPSTTRTPRSGVMTTSVQPSTGRTMPSGSAADSRARTTVVPIAMTRWPGAPGERWLRKMQVGDPQPIAVAIRVDELDLGPLAEDETAGRRTGAPSLGGAVDWSAQLDDPTVAGQLRRQVQHSARAVRCHGV